MVKIKFHLYKLIKRLEVITKTQVKTGLLGTYKSVFRGEGLEFTGYREYTQNDDATMIDWKATARTHKALIKEYEEERNIQTFFLVDISSSMVFGSTDKLKNIYSAELALSLCYAMLEIGDAVGYALFNDKVIVKSEPLNNKNQFFLFSKELSNTDIYGGSYDLEDAVVFLNKFLKPGSIIFIISDFIGLKDGWQKPLKIASQKFDIIGVMIRDPRDKYLPSYNRPIILADPDSDKEILVLPNSIKEYYTNYVEQQEKSIKEKFTEAGADLMTIYTDKPFINPLIDFFKKREHMFR